MVKNCIIALLVLAAATLAVGYSEKCSMIEYLQETEGRASDEAQFYRGVVADLARSDAADVKTAVIAGVVAAANEFDTNSAARGVESLRRAKASAHDIASGNYPAWW
jgi:hypothetical protein